VAEAREAMRIPLDKPIRWTAFLRSWHHYQGNQRAMILIRPSSARCVPARVASRSPSQSRSRFGESKSI